MGFLKFLQKGKQQQNSAGMDDLDMPPAPPGGAVQEDLAKMPNLPDMPEPNPPAEFTQTDEIPAMEPPMSNDPFSLGQQQSSPHIQEEEFSYPTNNEQISGTNPYDGVAGAENSNDLDDKKSEEDTATEEERPHMSATDNTGYYNRVAKRAVAEEKQILRHEKTVDGPIFIQIDRFRNIISSLSSMKTQMKQANDSLQTMVDIESNKDKSYEKWKGNMNDLQKKLIFIEQTIFKR